MTTSLSIAEILLFIKRWGKCPSQTLPNNARVMLTYARQYWRQRTVRQRLHNFFINKNKMIT